MFWTELSLAHRYQRNLSKRLVRISCLPSRKFKIGLYILHVIRPHLYLLQEAAPENSMYHFSLLQNPQKFELLNHALCFLLAQKSCGIEQIFSLLRARTLKTTLCWMSIINSRNIREKSCLRFPISKNMIAQGKCCSLTPVPSTEGSLVEKYI